MLAVVTEGYSFNPGDLDWKTLDLPGLEWKIFDRTSADQVLDHCRDAVIIVSNKVVFDRKLLQQLPSLKMITLLATGYNVIDTAAASELGIVVCNVPAYGTASVAQHSIALLLELCNKVAMHAASVAEGNWVKSIDWCYTLGATTELEGKTMGIVGWGNIGQRTALIASALGMKIIYYNRSKKESALGQQLSLEALFGQSDVISLHCPLTADNHAFVNASLLSRVKKGALLINTARGQLLHEADVAAALEEGRLGGAALDVLSTEPPAADNPLLRAPNCIITPHIAWMSREARARIMQMTKQNLQAFLEGNPVHRVN
ncbi:MAG TPA: D-2-hydroxyacid dehydrogenase [Chitinophagaceae bacterium]|nr:D-2-hydroxyacid dehydrogenase [Chitinophagaceae bacterium]